MSVELPMLRLASVDAFVDVIVARRQLVAVSLQDAKCFETKFKQPKFSSGAGLQRRTFHKKTLSQHASPNHVGGQGSQRGGRTASAQSVRTAGWRFSSSATAWHQPVGRAAEPQPKRSAGSSSRWQCWSSATEDGGGLGGAEICSHSDPGVRACKEVCSTGSKDIELLALMGCHHGFGAHLHRCRHAF